MTTERLVYRIWTEVPLGATVLDLGGAMAPYHQALLARQCRLTVVDAHLPYLEWGEGQVLQVSQYEKPERPGLVKVFSDVRVFTELLKPSLNKWDVVMGIDFIEHLERSQAIEVVAWMKRAALERVVLFVPEGYHPQHEDARGMGGDYWQTHRSTWWAADVEELGFDVEVWPDFHAGDPEKDSGALWCTWSAGSLERRTR